MADPRDDQDPIYDAPTQARRGRNAPTQGPGDPYMSVGPAWGEPIDQTVIRARMRSIDLGADGDVRGVTPEAADRYKREGPELGRGGIGRVMVAFDSHLGRDVAIKELLPASFTKHPEDTAGDLARFLREARITGQLEHPSIVPVYELGQRDDGSHYYSMKFVRGRTLRQAIDQAEGFSGRMALLRHFVDVANAIAYAHSRGVVHRDIKPENIMLGEFGETVVLDWGLAKGREKADPLRPTLPRNLRGLKGTNAPETMVGEVVGTPAYMSPEQAGGQVDLVNERSDVWALGAVLYEILAGQTPFRAPGVEALLLRVIQDDFKPVREVEANAPAELAAIAEKALRKAPDERYPNARALVEDVIAFQNGRQVGAYDYSAWDLLKKVVHEYRAAAIATLLITITVVVALIAVIQLYLEAENQRDKAELSKKAEAEARMLAEANEKEAHDNLSVALTEKARLLTRQQDFGAAGVYAAAGIFHSPYFESSPFKYDDLDEREPHDLAMARLGPRSALYEVLARRQLELTSSLDTGTADVCAFDLFAEGNRLLSGNDAGGYVLWDLVNQRPMINFDGPKCPRRIDVAPNGKLALIITRERTGVLMDLEDGSRRPVVGNDSTLRGLLFGRTSRVIYVVGSKGSIERRNAKSLALLNAGEVSSPRIASFTPDFGRLAIGNRDGTVRLLDPVTLQVQQAFTDHSSSIWSVAFSADGRYMVAGGFEGYAVVRELDSGKIVATLPGEKPIYTLAFTADGTHVIGAAFETGRIWHLDEQASVQTFRVYKRGVEHLAIRPGTHQVLTAGFGPHVQVWRFDATPLTTRFPGHAKPIYGFASSPSGGRVATSDGKGVIRVWDATSARLIRPAKQAKVWSLAFLGNDLLSISSRGEVLRWADGQQAEVLAKESKHRHGSHVSIAAVDGLAAWTGSGGSVVVYDQRQEQTEAPFSDLAGQSTAVAFSGSGQLLAAADDKGNLVIRDLSSGLIRWRRAEAHRGIISGLSFQPGGELLASAGRDRVIRLWSTTDGQEIGVLRSHEDWVNTIAFSHDGRWLVSGSDDQTARLWSVSDRLPVLKVTADTQIIAAGFISGRDLMVVGRDTQLLSLPVAVASLELRAESLLEEAQLSSGLLLKGFELAPQGGQR